MPAPDHTARRRKANRRGHWAEIRAVVALLLTGYRILALRYKTSGGEIDIIAKRGGLVVMIEVKARSTFRNCVEAVTPANQRRVHSAAHHWLARQKHGERHSVRFDIVAVVPWRWPRHFKNMF